MLSLPKNALSYIKGLMCVFENANCSSLARIVNCSHDSLTRVLNEKKFCWQTLLQNFLLRTFEKLQGGWLIIDDTIISKVFAKKIENISWVFDTKLGKSILGINLVLLAWSNGRITIPLAIRVYQKNNGKTKIDLAVELLQWARKVGIKPKFVVFDSWYGAVRIMRKVENCNWKFATQLKKNRKLNGVPLHEIYRNPYWQKQGVLSGGIKVLVVRHGKKYFATDDLSWSKQDLLSAYKGRWEIETIFRALHSKLGIDDCQSRKLSDQIAHFNLCLIAYTALEKESFIQNKTFYQVKRDCSFNFQKADSVVNTLFFQGA